MGGLCVSRSPYQPDYSRQELVLLHEWWVTLCKLVRKQRTTALIREDSRKVNADSLSVAHERFHREANAALNPLMEQIFDLYDQSKTGVLSKEESIKFFDDFVNEASVEKLALHTLCNHANYISTHRTAMSLMKERQTNPGAADTEDVWAKHEEYGKNITKQIENMACAYQADREPFQQAAFKVLDAKQNGQIERDELTKGLTIGSPKFTRFTEALGFKALSEIKELETQQPMGRRDSWW